MNVSWILNTKLWKKSYTAEELKQVNPVNLLSALSILDPSFKMVENNLDGSNPNVIPDFSLMYFDKYGFERKNFSARSSNVTSL